MAHFDLLFQEVARKARVPPFRVQLGVEVDPAVVTPGEARNGIDACTL